MFIYYCLILIHCFLIRFDYILAILNYCVSTLQNCALENITSGK